MFIEFTDKMQTIALDKNPICIIAINEKNKAVIVEHSFSIILTRAFKRGPFSVSAGANNMVDKIDSKQMIEVDKVLKL